MIGEVPNADKELRTQHAVKENWNYHTVPFVPERAVVMDIIQFCHTYMGDYSATTFRNQINTLFERNALAFKLLENGNIERLLNPILSKTLKRSQFNSGDVELDKFLEKATSKFLHHDIKTRKEALEALWDAFERLKTINQSDKPASVKILLEQSSDCEALREIINAESAALTKIGNNFMIRHSETDRTPIEEEKHIDYLFHRMFSLIWLWLESHQPNTDLEFWRSL